MSYRHGENDGGARKNTRTHPGAGRVNQGCLVGGARGGDITHIRIYLGWVKGKRRLSYNVAGLVQSLQSVQEELSNE